MTDDQQRAGTSRRSVLTYAAAAGVAGISAAAPPATASESGPARQGRKKTVAVLGSGIGGLTAAHELAERGFEVTVYERLGVLGGKSRTIPLAGSGEGGRLPLPGEHGARGFTSFYQHVHDTMRRIPLAGQGTSVYDNLVSFSVADVRYARAHGLPDGNPLMFGFYADPREALTPNGLKQILVNTILEQHTVPPTEAEYLAERFVVYLTSSDKRRFGQWEHVDWWQFVGAQTRSPEYQNLAATGLTRALVAAKETLASTRTIGNMAEQFLLATAKQLAGGPEVYQVLNGPTNEAWLDPWVARLRHLGVGFEVDQDIESLTLAGGRITGARSRQKDGSVRSIDADWFVCAVPTDRARELWSPEIRRADPALARMDDLHLSWMNGIQFFLTEQVNLGNGYNVYLDAPWRLTSYVQNTFWHTNYPHKYGDGASVNGLTVDIADWNTPGILFGKPAKRCSRGEIRHEVWAQLQAALNDDGSSELPNGIVHEWMLDPAITWSPVAGRNQNEAPLVVNTVGSWHNRPTARTNIPNLFLAADYVRTDFGLASMECANEAGRRAANALLEAADSGAPPAQLYTRYQPAGLESLKQVDAARYEAGQPNLFDHQRGGLPRPSSGG